MSILDLLPQTASTVLLRQHAAAPWHAEYARESRVVGLMYHASAQRALDGEWVPSGAWRASFVAGQGWRVVCGYGVEPPDCAAARAWLAGLCGAKVDWTAADGFNPRAGALGLRHPWREVVLRWPDGALRYLVIGQPDGPHGVGVFLFDKLAIDANGNPHPLGLWVLERN